MLFFSRLRCASPFSIDRRHWSFNLVIEMLFFSSIYFQATVEIVGTMFQSRNRDAFLFKLGVQSAKHPEPVGFNLVIEMLFFSSERIAYESVLLDMRFNLVIEMLFFSSNIIVGLIEWWNGGFNLVIEMLFFSSDSVASTHSIWGQWFQSRNRDAFLFKFFWIARAVRCGNCFNLVIEMLFFSSPSAWKSEASQSFRFQSRNRDAFLFKAASAIATHFAQLVSIS